LDPDARPNGGSMRLLSVPALITLAFAAAVGQPTSSPARIPGEAAHNLKGLEEFLNWAHPKADGCESPTDVSIVQIWDGGLRARYRIVCGPSVRALQGVFK